MDLEDLIAAYGLIMILVPIIVILYFVILLYKICKISKNNKKFTEEIKKMNDNISKNNELNLAYLKKFTTQFERIAKALEQDQEPYIIESDKENK